MKFYLAANQTGVEWYYPFEDQSPMTLDQQEQIQRFVADEPSAFAEIYAEYKTRIYRFCFRLCGSAEDAEDLTQNVFVAAYESRHRFAGRASFATWLYQIALFQRSKQVRSPQHRVVGLNEVCAREIPASNFGISELAHIDLANALALLPETWRRAFLLVKAEELTIREVAEILRVPQGTVKYWIHRAVKRLNALMQDDGKTLPTAPNTDMAQSEKRRAAKTVRACRVEGEI